MKTYWKYILVVLTLAVLMVWLMVFSFNPSKLFLVACDVGQGDSILAVYGTFQVLTDGGPPNGKLSECLSKHMPFWDRKIEVVINTHPQLDHYGGLIDVFKSYKVDYFVANALENSAQEYQVLKKEVGSAGALVITPLKGTSVRYGVMHYDIFWPTKGFLSEQGWSGELGQLGTFVNKRDPNDFSIQAVISFGEFRALLTGDIGQNMKDLVIPNFSEKSVNYLKVPHHGSKYGLTAVYLEDFTPNLAVISVGAKNGYGHPTKEIIDILQKNVIRTYRTDLGGSVLLETDGKTFRVKRGL